MVILEIIGLITTLWCVHLTVKENILAWPIGIVANIAFFLIFYENNLYGEMTLQLIFIGQSINGWLNWANKKNVAVIHEIAYNKFAYHFLQAVFVTLFLTYSISTLSMLDVFSSILSVIATYYLSKKIFQSWMLWILVDIILIGLFISKELYISAILYLILLILAIRGYLAWDKELKKYNDEEI